MLRNLIKNKFLLVILVFALINLYTYANDIKFEVNIDRNLVALGEVVQLNFTFYGLQNISPPKLEKIENFEVRYRGPSTQISIINGVINSSITHTYSLIPTKTGKFTLGPFSIDIKGKTFTSGPITIEVVSSKSATSTKADEFILTPEALKDRIFLVLELGKKKAYLGEIIPLTVKLYVNNLNLRDIDFPEIVNPDFSIEKFNQPKQYREELGGVFYNVIEFTTNIYGLKIGDFKLGPAKLKCNLILRRKGIRKKSFRDDIFDRFFDDDIFEDFFGNYEVYPIELTSPEFSIKILDFPEIDKPKNFDGAVGNFNLEAEASPLNLKVGDPITLRVKISGEGNFSTVKAPKIEFNPTYFKVYEPQIKEKNNEKLFEWVIIPLSDRVKEIPQINFSFFEPNLEKYQTLSYPAIPITVIPTPEPQPKLIESPLKTDIEEDLGKGILYIKTSLGSLRRINSYLFKNFWFWFFNIFILFLFILIIVFYYYREHLEKNSRYLRNLQASSKIKKDIKELEKLLKEKDSKVFFDTLFKIFKEYLSNKFNLPLGLGFEEIENLIKEKLDQEILNKIKIILSDCDKSRYASLELSREKIEEDFKTFKEVVMYLERQKF